MAEPISTYRVTSPSELTNQLRLSLLGDNDAFLEGLYDPKGLADPDLRPLVANARDETARLFAMARDKLAPTSCEVLREEQRGTSHVVTFLVNGQTRIEVLVDDVHERGGILHTMDRVQFKLLSTP